MALSLFDPSTPIRIYLARHGQTEANVQGCIRGRLDVALNAQGHRQAQALATLAADHAIGRVVAGPLRRAQQTAAYIARAAGVDVQTDDALVDRDYGRWTGWPHARVRAMFGSAGSAPGVEPYVMFAARARRALRRVVATARHGEGIVIVGHQALNRVLLGTLFPAHVLPTQCIVQAPGSWRVVEFDGCRWTLASENRGQSRISIGNCEANAAPPSKYDSDPGFPRRATHPTPLYDLES